MRLAILATTLVLGFGVGALGACASASEAPAWFEARSAENDSGYPSLREVPRGTDANTDAGHWAAVEAEVVAARTALKASPRSEPATQADDPATFLDQAREDLEEAREAHSPN